MDVSTAHSESGENAGCSYEFLPSPSSGYLLYFMMWHFVAYVLVRREELDVFFKNFIFNHFAVV